MIFKEENRGVQEPQLKQKVVVKKTSTGSERNQFVQ